MNTTKEHLLKTLNLMTQTAKTALEELNKDAGLMREQIDEFQENADDDQ